ncbi:MAG: sensor domain-containing diguanylate cyclase [Planctomycetota bacterium]|nr:sensor domain-containing diguanylate cyclase [Planctomycetota bacterium]MDI6786857.1 sensor domain-containing diguanylate cyclase [Planctomycetota bacterium]
MPHTNNLQSTIINRNVLPDSAKDMVRTSTIVRPSERFRYLENILNFSPDIIICGDSNGRIVEFNKGVEKLLGFSRNEVLGKPIADLYFNPRDRDKLLNILQRIGQVVDYETRLKTKTGGMIHVSTSVAYIYDEKGRVVGTIGIAKDIRRRKELEKKLKRLAITDGLTNLYDRGYFNIALPRTIDRTRQSKELLGCIMIDLDGFKEYNDKEGHLGGDSVLRKVGEIIIKTIPHKNGSAYRYGGDEFIILISGRKQNALLSIAEKIRSEVEKNFNGKITASVGVTFWQKNQTPHQLVKNADNSMYRAKSYGGNRVCIS